MVLCLLYFLSLSLLSIHFGIALIDISTTLSCAVQVLLAAVKGSNNKNFIFAAGGGKAGDHQEELRSVPSGPDPLHHNGGSPKKPRPSSP
ncbi:unnamed protein product [Linum tenue]|uniref:Uncharacterized protein n=1 Tax=Linum tenue TaxID=586396 RepID=A0AAV0QIC0_9ROSI|nr:unnamed protein product [Linum tenue]